MNNIIPAPSWSDADFVPLLRNTQTPTIFASDYDWTRTDGHGKPTPEALQANDAIDSFVKEQGMVDMGVSARPLSMALSLEAFHASKALGFDQPYPHWKQDEATKLHSVMDLKDDPFYRGCLDKHISASLGGGMMYRVGTAHVIDRKYEFKLKYDHVAEIRHVSDIDALDLSTLPLAPWRLETQAFIHQYYPEILSLLPDIEFAEKFRLGKTNSAPQIARFEFRAKNKEELAVMQGFLLELSKRRLLGNRLALRIKYTTEDKIDPDNPDNSTHTLYLLPFYGRKSTMFDWAIEHAAAAAERPVRDLLIFYAGDAITDLLTALKGGRDGMVIAAIAKNSRIARALIEKWQFYGTHYLGDLWANPLNGRTQDRLRAVPGERGLYTFDHKVRGGRKNLLIITDQRYPDEKTAPGSVFRMIDEFGRANVRQSLGWWRDSTKSRAG